MQRYVQRVSDVPYHWNTMEEVNHPSKSDIVKKYQHADDHFHPRMFDTEPAFRQQSSHMLETERFSFQTNSYGAPVKTLPERIVRFDSNQSINGPSFARDNFNYRPPDDFKYRPNYKEVIGHNLSRCFPNVKSEKRKSRKRRKRLQERDNMEHISEASSVGEKLTDVLPKTVSHSFGCQKRKAEKDSPEINCKKACQVNSAGGSEMQLISSENSSVTVDITAEYTSLLENGIPNESKIVAMDCEFVGVGPKKSSALGRCSIVDFNGKVVCDIYAKPDAPVTDYRTRWSGIRRRDLMNAMSFRKAKHIISNILKDKIVIGHAVFNDFKVLQINHPWYRIRDTIQSKTLKKLVEEKADRKGCSLKLLSKHLLGRDIQRGEHSSVEDSIAALDLYKLVQREFEERIATKMGLKIDKTQNDQTVNCKNDLGTAEVNSNLSFELCPNVLFDEK